MNANRRMTLTVAFACALSSIVLYPLFISSEWFYVGLGAIITVAASGALSRLRTLPVVVCLAISVAGLLLYLNLVFEARHSWALVIPTPGSLSRLWDLAGTGMTDASRYAAPAPALPGLLLLAAGGIGITAILTDLIAVRLRSAALAGLPLLVLFTVPITMNAQHEGLGTAVVFCLGTVGYLAMLSADGRERIRVWGRLVSLWRSGSLYDGTGGRGQARADDVYPGMPAEEQTSPAHRITGQEPGPDTRALAAAGRRVGLASVVLALCVPLLVPGLHPSKLFSSGPGIGGRGGSGTGAGLSLPDTLSQTMRELQAKHPTTVLSYTTTAAKDPPYLQTYVYDDLTDSGWHNTDYAADEAQASTIPAAQGLLDQAAYRQVRTAVNVAGDALNNRTAPTFLAMPYPAVQVSTPPGVWLTDSELMVFSQYHGASVQGYQATSVDVAPTTAHLRAAAKPPRMQADLALPSSYQARALKQIADEHTAGQTTEYGKVNALAAWLSGPAFAYSAAGAPVNSAATLYNFLAKTRLGVCVQSAWAMTVLTRLLGIPARLAGGFTEGTHGSGKTYVVKTDDAHVWAQVYFSGYGWINFEATPSGGDGTAQASSYQSGTGAGNGAPPNIPGSIGSSAGPTKVQPTAGGQANKIIGAGGGSRSRPAGQVRRHAVGGGPPGHTRRHRPGVRGHRDRGPARAPGAVGPCPRRGPAAASGEHDQRGAGSSRGGDRRAGAVPAAGPCLRPEPGGRLGDGRHRLRRGRRVRVRGAGRDPGRGPAMALAAGPPRVTLTRTGPISRGVSSVTTCTISAWATRRASRRGRWPTGSPPGCPSRPGRRCAGSRSPRSAPATRRARPDRPT